MTWEFRQRIADGFLGALTYCGIVLLVAAPVAASDSREQPSSIDRVPSNEDFKDIQQEVETLRGKKFIHKVPVYKVSERELRAISDRGLDKQFQPGELDRYEELLAWMDLVPPGTDLKSAEQDYVVDQVAGLYDSDAKEMCIPFFSSGATNAGNRPAEKKLEQISPQMDRIVLAHEFTHALEDQYWPLDDPQDDDTSISSDRGTAHSFVSEGSATRLMTEAIPGEVKRDAPGTYFLLWNLIHSDLGEFVLRGAFGGVWKSSDALVEGVPESLSRTEAMPYAFGYNFCTEILRKWGLDGLDYIYDHPPVSSEQVMHPTKSWEWRDFPVQIDLPESLPGNWEQVSIDIVGEAGIAILFGCQFQNLNRGLEIARGWDGDHVALYDDQSGHRLLLWASSWDSTNAAGRYVSACLKERQLAHNAVIKSDAGNRIKWESSDNRFGFIVRDQQRVILVETDSREFGTEFDDLADSIVFTEPAEDAARAAENSSFRRFNPVWAWQKDGDYVVARSLGGLLSRHDRNSVGAADSILMGAVAESRRTTSFKKWEIGGGLIANHESEARRGTSQTRVLPWGVLASHSSARLPYAPQKTIAHTSILWGLGGKVATDANERHSIHVLPFGLLFNRVTSATSSSFHILGTGYSRKVSAGASTTRYRLFGIPVSASHRS